MLLKPLQIFICDDHPMTHDGLEICIRKSEYFKDKSILIESAFTGQEMLELLKNRMPDCIVADLSLPDAEGVDLVKKIKKLAPNVPILVVTGSQSISVLNDICQLQVAGVMHKSNYGGKIASVLAEIIFKTETHPYIDPLIDRFLEASVGAPLSPREYEVLHLIGTSKKVTEIASLMNISVASVRTYMDRISVKTGAVGLSELVSLYINGNFKRDLSSDS